ncbi:cytochrome b-c1 complex subunit 7-like [Amphibalanus amphitrite]|uniref:cytochrome b-c1 complex subunit 7-like n=1 Tax=Amphibalanus amphitrite TaxID=1232801 RepID=UPI001C8FBCD1|nr:cytochrome b-c1 complex subunit 7-like [Amphibalanus amphitrite]
MASVATKAAGGGAMQWLRRWAYSASGFNKLGLWHDDCLYEDDEVKEAVRRLPERLQDDRTFRITRAMQLSLSHQILPREQWTTFDEDIRYLKPYLEEVRKENREKAEWSKK